MSTFSHIYIFILWVTFSIVIGVAANSRGRDGVGWCLLSLLISPLLAGIMLFVLPAHMRRKVLRTLRQCPACRELVKREARICKHCGSWLPPSILIELESKEARAARLKVQDRRAIISTAVAVSLILGLFAFFAISARAEEQQTRFYDKYGNSIGTATPQGEGSVRYRDARGNSIGTSTTDSTGTTTFYDARGTVTGRASAPAPLNRVFPGGRR